MASGGSKGGIRSDINVTPLVDVVLVLLIIFMVVLPQMQRDKTVALPPADHGVQTEKTQGTPEPLVLTVTADKQVFVGSELLADAAALKARLAREVASAPSRRLRLAADRTLAYADVRWVVKAAEDAGAKALGFGVEQRSAK